MPTKTDLEHRLSELESELESAHAYNKHILAVSGCLRTAFSHIENTGRVRTIPQSPSASQAGAFPFIPMDPDHFVIRLMEARKLLPDKYPRLSFLDVGCGIGTKVLLARCTLWCNCYGLELDPAYIPIARKITDEPNTIIEGNALEFDRYHEFDIIYFYRPMMDAKKQTELEDRVAEHAKPGAVIIALGCSTIDMERRHPFLKRAGHEMLKVGERCAAPLVTA